VELKFECPTCGQHLSATRDQIGVTAPCPNCNAAVTVPNTSTLPPSLPSSPPQSPPANTAMATSPKRCGFHWLIAGPLSLWCLVWLVFNGYNYLYLTWRIFATLKWLSFALLINPCFAIWIGAFSSSVWAPLNFVALPWGTYDAEFSRGKVALVVLFVPLLLGLALQFIGPYFYPITWGGENGHHVFLRFIPFFGGKGYE